MRIMVTGSRDWRDILTIDGALGETSADWHPSNVTVIQGCASGADAIARACAKFRGMEVEDYWPDYARFSFAEANKRRNITMVESQPHVVLAFPTARSRGTWHAVGVARKAGIEVREFQEAR